MGYVKKRGGRRRRWVYWSLVSAGVLAFLTFSVAAIWWVPGIFVDVAQGENPAPILKPSERVTAVTNARQGVLFVIGGLIAVVTLLITLARHNLDRDANWTTRYTEAIKQLGDSSFAIQLGGIYALERIAQDSERDRQTILDVLCSYLRAESPLEDEDGTDAGKMKSNVGAVATATGRISQLSHPTNRTTLAGVNLTDANLTGADFTYADFTGANLTGANLTDASLFAAVLSGANLSGADLSDANLHGADLSDANLTGSLLLDADLTHAFLFEADLSSAHLSDADLSNAILYDADLSNAYLSGADLSGADLSDAKVWEELDTGEVQEILITKEYLQEKGAKGLDSVKGLPAEEGPAVP